MTFLSPIVFCKGTRSIKDASPRSIFCQSSGRNAFIVPRIPFEVSMTFFILGVVSSDIPFSSDNAANHFFFTSA